MIKTCQIIRKGDDIVLGIALENSILEILTNDAQLQKCLQALQRPQDGLISFKVGSFGDYPVILNLRHNGAVSVFIDGPGFDKSQRQCAGIFLAREELQRLLNDAMQGAKGAPGLSTIA